MTANIFEPDLSTVFELTRLAPDGAYIDDDDVRKLQRLPYEEMVLVSDSGTFIRKLVLVGYPPKDKGEQRLYWADRKTGTLYRMDGSCCSSSRQWIEAA